MTTHPFLKYAIALLMVRNNLQKEEEIDDNHILYELENGLNHYALKAPKVAVGRNIIKYRFTEENVDFRTPSFINKEAKSKINELIGNKLTKCNLSIACNPFAGEFSIFTSQGKGLTERGKPKWTLREYCLGSITLSTPDKPCYSDKKNWCLIPDLELPDMILFINLFEEMYTNELPDLMEGKIKWNRSKHTLCRPRLLNGNFPYAPQTSVMGAVALLGAIGKFAKDAKDQISPEVCNVVNRLKNTNIYLVSSDEIKVFSFNHVIIDLASKGELQSIVDSIYRIELFKVGNRSKIDKFNNIRKNEYDRFDLFVSRFLTLFNKASFRGFFSFRAEYPNEMELLLKTYFCIMEKINEDIVNSAIAFGNWLNFQAFTYASKEIPVNENLNEKEKEEKKEKQRELKNKILIQFESAIMSAKTGDALVAFITTRAARLTGYDIYESAKLFMSKVSCGELPLEQAKNLLIAFSRLKTVNKK